VSALKDGPGSTVILQSAHLLVFMGLVWVQMIANASRDGLVQSVR
jgi:hypothetical protein